LWKGKEKLAIRVPTPVDPIACGCNVSKLNNYIAALARSRGCSHTHRLQQTRNQLALLQQLEQLLKKVLRTGAVFFLRHCLA